MTSNAVPEVRKQKKTPPPASTLLDKPLDIADIKIEKAQQVREILQSLKKRVGNARRTPEKYSVARVDELAEDMELALKAQKSLEHASTKVTMNGRQLLAQLADMALSMDAVQDAGHVASLKLMKKDLEQQLPVVLERELYQWFSGELSKLRTELAEIRKSIALTESALKKVETDAVLRQRVAAMKGYDDVNSLKGDVMKQTDICGSVPKATREMLFHPVWLSRKLEKEFHVVIDKSHDTHSKSDGCYIAGCAKDVDACVARLETTDFHSGKKTLLLDGKTLSSVMGTGGANAYEIEKAHGVILYAPPGSVELTIFGTEKDVAKALKTIGDVREISPSLSSSGSAITSDKLKCNTAVARALQSLTSESSTIEETCGVSISVAPVSETPRESWVTVRGPNEGVANAISAMHSAIGKMGFETVEGPSVEAVNLLLGGQNSGPKKGLSEVRLLMRFNDLKRRAVVARVPTDASTSIDVVTSNPEAMDEIVAELMDILAKVTHETVKFELDREHSRVWNATMCALVGSAAGVELTARRHDDGSFALEVWGAARERASARLLIDEVQSARVIPVPEEVIKPMLENKCQVLQSLQTDATVTAHFGKFENELWLYGLEANKRTAVKLFDQFVQSVRDSLLQATIKTIPIASDEIGKLIGPKGRVMLGIKDKAQLDEIRISEAEHKVYLTGSNSSIDYAVSLIEEELSAKKDTTVVQIGLAEDEATAAILSGAVNAAKIGGLMGANKTNEWVSEKAPEVQEPVAMDSQDLFPSLGGASKPKSKLKWK